jgi:hypothetical protein
MTVSARRAFEVFDLWGSIRYQGSNITIFQEDLGAIGAALSVGVLRIVDGLLR